ncbi:MAG: hypothetical protein P8099_18865 [Gemmatimonadota bacterium]|jgi:hypothetical protein
MRMPLGSKLVTMAVVLTTAQLLGCKDNTGPDNPDTIVGSWTATSLTAPSRPDWGDAITGDGLSLGMTFNASGGYGLSAANDDPADPWICWNTASCSYSGTYSTSGNTMLFDEGTADEATATYSLSGGTLTITYQSAAGVTDPYKVTFTKS